MAQNPHEVKNDRDKRKTNALPPPPPAAIADALRIKTLTVEWLAGDGSDRCYYRILSPELSGPQVLMQLSGSDAVALKNDGYDWVKIARVLDKQGIFVPRVIATMPDHAALIIEDYGDDMLEGRVFAMAENDEIGPIRTLYKQCSEIIAHFLAIPQQPDATWCKRSFDEERFVWELNFFMQKYAGPVAKIELTEAEQKTFDDETLRLSQALAANSKYFVHRDFHSRNIMARDQKLAIIDFQDARLGPAAYDFVSLCFDSYVPFSAETRSEIFADALAVVKEKLPANVLAEIEALWKPMLLQRQLKAIGSFGYLTIDKQRGDYLKYVEPALKTLEDQDVRDSRWPFISDILLRRIRAHLNAHGSSL